MQEREGKGENKFTKRSREANFYTCKYVECNKTQEDKGPWPLPVQYVSPAFPEPNDVILKQN